MSIWAASSTQLSAALARHKAFQKHGNLHILWDMERFFRVCMIGQDMTKHCKEQPGVDDAACTQDGA